MNIRLKDYEIVAITDAFKKLFLPQDHLWIFGSRVDMDKRGGDIDLYIETGIEPALLFELKLKFINAICEAIGDQRIDVVLDSVHNSLNLPIYAKAKHEGVKLL